MKRQLQRWVSDASWMVHRNSFQDQEYISCVEDILDSSVFQSMNQYIQHGHTTCLEHCVQVSYLSYRICRLYGLEMCIRDRGTYTGNFQQVSDDDVLAENQALQNATGATAPSESQDDPLLTDGSDIASLDDPDEGQAAAGQPEEGQGQEVSGSTSTPGTAVSVSYTHLDRKNSSISCFRKN